MLPRIHILFDEEDPIKFSKRVAHAHIQRTYADSLLKYNHYIENMPTQDGDEVNSEQTKRLEKLTLTKHLEGLDTTYLILEINRDFSKSMNKIIFDKYLEEANADLLPHNLKLPIKKIEEVI